MRDEEKLMVKLGKERYRKKVQDSRATGAETFTVAGRYLLKESVARIEDALDEWLLRAAFRSSVPAGRSFSVEPLLKSLPTGVTALITMKVVLDQIARERSYMTTALNIANRLEDESRFRTYYDAMPPQARRLLKTYFSTGYTKLRQKVREAVLEYEVPFAPWKRKLKARLGTMLLEMVRQETGLIEIRSKPTHTGKTQLMIVPDDVSLAWLEEAHEKHETLFPFYLPLSVPPADWESLYDGGYFSDIMIRRPLVKSDNDDQLAEIDAADMAQVYSAVNHLQRTAWEVNRPVYDVMKQLWEAGSTIAGLPTRDDERPPKAPDDYKTNEEAAKAWRRIARMIHDRNRANASHRLMVSKVLFMAERYLDGPFYYPQQLDFRGRLYPIPFFLQPQGPSLARGLLQFHQGAPLRSDESRSWWLRHGANCYGLDKLTFEEREAWARDALGRAERVAADPLADLWWTEAEKPWEFLAWCLEAPEVWSNGAPSKIPVQMDGSNNGLQIFSLLLRDEVGGRATNCTPSERPQDIYQEVADRVTEKLGMRRVAGEDFAERWLKFCPTGMPRKAVKRQVMTLPYGATGYSCHQYTMDWFLSARGSSDYNPFPKDYYTPCWWLSRLIWEAIGEVVVAARAGMDWLQAVAKVMTQQGLPIRWTSPVGFPVRQTYTDYSSQLIKTSYGDSVRQVMLRSRGSRLSGRQQKQGISPNFVHSLDAAALMLTVNLAAERGVENFMMIHDSFGTTAADAPLLAEVLRRAYVEIFSEDILEDFRESVIAQGADPAMIPPVPPKGTLDVNDLISSLYFFA